MKISAFSIKTALALAAVVSMSGCAQYMKTVTKMQNYGYELHEDSVNAHVYAEVSRSELFTGDLVLPRRTSYMPLGVESDNGTYNFRIVEAYMTLLDPPLPGYLPVWAHGVRFAFRAAVVPDQFPRLMEGDIIELRNTGTYEILTDFPHSGEGAIVTRVFCRAGTPEYKSCRGSLPVVGRSPRPAGQTGTAFKPSVKDYAPLTFSRWYDDNGKALRPFPSAFPAGFEPLPAIQAGVREGGLAPEDDKSVRRNPV